MFYPILLFVAINLVRCDETETFRLVGVDTTHNSDSVVAKKLNLKARGNPGAVDTKDGSPGPSYSAIPKEMAPYAEEFKRNMTECLKEVQEADTRPVRRLSPRTESPVHGECLIACVLKRNDVIQNGKVNKDNLLALISKFFGKDTKVMKKLSKHIDRCVAMSARHEDECDLAAKLNVCTNDLMAYKKLTLSVN